MVLGPDLQRCLTSPAVVELRVVEAVNDLLVLSVALDAVTIISLADEVTSSA